MIMKLLLIASQKTAAEPKKKYSSAEFDEMIRDMLEGDIVPIENGLPGTDGRPVYVSTQKTSLQTAGQLFPGAPLIPEPLLNEVPLRAYRDTDRPLPLQKWLFMARWQRFRKNDRQPESRAQAVRRADKLISLLEENGQDCILVSHPIFLKLLTDRLNARGCNIIRSRSFGIAPLERILVTRRDMHCGGCGHNCLLSHPGCGVGKEAAARKGIAAK